MRPPATVLPAVASAITSPLLPTTADVEPTALELDSRSARAVKVMVWAAGLMVSVSVAAEVFTVATTV